MFRQEWGRSRKRELAVLCAGQDWLQDGVQGCPGSPHSHSALHHSLSRKQAVTQLQKRGCLSLNSIKPFRIKKIVDCLFLVIKFFAKKLCRKKRDCREVKQQTQESDVYSLPTEKNIVINNINLVITSCPCQNHRHTKDFGNNYQENLDKELILTVVKNKYQTLWANNDVYPREPEKRKNTTSSI